MYHHSAQSEHSPDAAPQDSTNGSDRKAHPITDKQ